MREIKFRAWAKDINKMLFVGDEYGTTHPLDCAAYFKQGQNVELMQYTGLKDVNGVEIYEGDLIVVRHKKGEHRLKEKPTSVYFSDGAFLFELLTESREMFLFEVCHGDEVIAASHTCEVIGNIYENTELMK